jgi:hypothetical protein
MSNEIGQRVSIIQMEETMVPQKHGMEVIDHQNLIFHGK